jgi:pyruvate dehydrogenase E2 component (dihydrolipoamide acetyltransferase)
MALNIYEFKFPDVGEGIAEGKLVEWKVGVGDDIKVDQPLCSIETDKAVVDIPSPVTGKVVELLNKVNDTLIVGNVIITIDVGNDEKTAQESNNDDDNNNKQEIRSNNLGEDLSNIDRPKTTDENTYKSEKTQEQVIEKETSKEEIKTDKNIKVTEKNESKHINIKSMLGVRKYAKDNNIDLCKVTASGNHGQILMDDLSSVSQKEISKEDAKVDKKIKSPNETDKVEKVETETRTNSVQAVEKERPLINDDDHKLSEKQDEIRDIIASPSVRQLALQKQLDITKISGSGENGRITIDDINKYNPETPIKEEIKPESVKTYEQKEAEVEETIENKNPEELPRAEQKLDDHHLNQTTKSLTLPYDIPMPYDNVRQIIADKMVESLQNTAQLTIFNKINIDELVQLREKEKEILSKKGVKLTYLPFFIKAFITAAKEYPTFNAISTKNSTIIKSDFNIGIAMDTPRGLLVPNVFGAQNKSIVQIAKDISSLVEKSKKSKITLDDMSNGTFTITSLGAKGGQFFTPILNYPQTAILGIGEISKQPVVKNDEIIIGNVLHLSLTFDHRTLDGAEAAKFFNRYCELLKNVDLLLMEA